MHEHAVVVVSMEDLMELIFAAHPCQCSHPQDHHCYHFRPEEDGDQPIECCHCGLRRPLLGEDDPNMSLADWQEYDRVAIEE